MRMRALAVRYASGLGFYERRHLIFLRRYLHEGDTAVDVGANLGAYTMAMSAAVGRTGRVFAFEPLPEAFDLLTQNTRTLGNVTCRRLALSDTSGKRAMRVPLLFGTVPEVSLASLHVASPAAGEGEIREVQTARLDDFAAEVVGLRFLKVDIEGHEPACLSGAESVIRRDRPLIQFECDDFSRYFPWFAEFGRRFGLLLCALQEGALAPAHPHSRGNNFYLAPS
jgi:FkbM family methyltransferase